MIRLSPSKLNLLNDCKRCFYDANVLKLMRPRGIFPTLPSGIDRVLKGYFDSHRSAGDLPPEIREDIGSSVLYGDQNKINKWRHWRSGLTYEDSFQPGGGGEAVGVKMIGAIDDLLVDEDGKVSPFDYKTKGQEPKDSGEKWYQTQLDCYALMMQSGGLELTGAGYLLYVWPDSVSLSENAHFLSRSTNYSFRSKVYKLVADPDRALKKIQDAVDVIMGERPNVNMGCDHCVYATEMSGQEILDRAEEISKNADA